MPAARRAATAAIPSPAAPADEWISTGQDCLFWSLGNWNAASKAAYGGATDVVNSGDGDDTVLTMMYCNATVDTGKGHDDVFVLGLLDIVSTGDGIDDLTFVWRRRPRRTWARAMTILELDPRCLRQSEPLRDHPGRRQGSHPHQHQRMVYQRRQADYGRRARDPGLRPRRRM